MDRLNALLSRPNGWFKRNWIGLVLVGIFVALVVNNYYSSQNNKILRQRNGYFVEYTEQVRQAREDHKQIMARCGD